MRLFGLSVTRTNFRKKYYDLLSAENAKTSSIYDALAVGKETYDFEISGDYTKDISNLVYSYIEMNDEIVKARTRYDVEHELYEGNRKKLKETRDNLRNKELEITELLKERVGLKKDVKSNKEKVVSLENQLAEAKERLAWYEKKHDLEKERKKRYSKKKTEEKKAQKSENAESNG